MFLNSTFVIRAHPKKQSNEYVTTYKYKIYPFNSFKHCAKKLTGYIYPITRIIISFLRLHVFKNTNSSLFFYKNAIFYLVILFSHPFELRHQSRSCRPKHDLQTLAFPSFDLDQDRTFFRRFSRFGWEGRPRQTCQTFVRCQCSRWENLKNVG